MASIRAEDLRHEARDSKPFRQAFSASLLKQARGLKDSLQERAWQLKLLAPAPQDKKEAWRQEAARKEAARQEAARQEAAWRQEKADQEESKVLAADLARAWAAATSAALSAERAAAGAARAATSAKKAKAGANDLERIYAGICAGGGEGGSGGAAGPSEASEAAGVPDAYVCPITADTMTDPVCTSDGFTYDRRAITEWLRTKDTSPSTGAKLESKRLIPNITVRCLLQDL